VAEEEGDSVFFFGNPEISAGEGDIQSGNVDIIKSQAKTIFERVGNEYIQSGW